MNKTFLHNALILGLLSAMGPFAIDMYLPALPAIGQSLGADTQQVQLSLMAFFLAIGLCQLAYGPLSDIHGRKGPLYAGLGLFALGSIGCSLALAASARPCSLGRRCGAAPLPTQARRRRPSCLLP